MNKTDAKRVTLPLVMDRLKAENTSSKIKEQEPRPKSVLFIKGTHDHEASTSKASVFPTHTQKTLPSKVWWPKSTVLMPNKQPTRTPSKATKRWVPKAVLKAQGYYEGAKLVYIPKAKPPTPPTKVEPPKTKANTIPCVTSTKPT